jgi:hypothetical protein
MWQDLVAPFYMRYKITRRIDYLYVNGALKSDEWQVVGDYAYYYSDLAVTVEDVAEGGLSFYPNPASDYIQVEPGPDTDAARILLYNVSGQLIMNRVLEDGGRIPVSHLSEGVYILRMVQGNTIKTGKVLIE